ncbi:3-oxoacyl-[acyl-carrier-protein] synthase II [Colwellia chukchiensis]|uniref:Nodulation protein E n=1 Tax=Colwellia chukchiensis TaxID=641665 RepID=A0A1H7GPZ8_9GAMM|nr:beta-ketoacyl-[acyl-carrier-protein] synthase family protein [Colwellia chukchiensis]SEK40233.1 3-oxoacyl-[acyl-carrier-protein] synthase II [Colwellia chukchiensis]
MSDAIVVSGMGCISAAGNNVAQFCANLFQPTLANFIAPTLIQKPDENSYFLAAQVKDYYANEHFTKQQLKLLDPFAQFALLSAEQAIADAKLAINASNQHRISVVHGTSIGGQETIEQAYAQLFAQGKSRTHPFTVPKLLPSSACGHIAMKYGIKGPTFATSSACSSSGHAIAMATLMLRSNLIDYAIVGGAEACLTPGNFYAWHGLRVLAHDSCRPFSKNRSGLVMGEGAASLVLERESTAKNRGATCYAKLVGIGMSSDAHNIVQPLAQGAEQAMIAALKDAELSPSDIDYINAHGSGTTQNDTTESAAILSVFNDANAPFVSSTKGTHGHMLGAGAALEAIAAILALEKQTVPATANFVEKDPNCNINLVANNKVAAKLSHVMSNSFAFGGLNTSLIFQR